MPKKVLDPSETIRERRIRMTNERDEKIASLRKKIRKLQRENRKLEDRLNSYPVHLRISDP